jgi:hypothetical protein
MRVVGVTRLSGMVHRARVVPVADIDDDTERRAVLLPEVTGAVKRLIRRVFAAVLRNWTYVYFTARAIVDDRRKRMFVEVVVELAPLPCLGVGSLQFFHLHVSCRKGGEQQGISVGGGINAEADGRLLQPCQHKVHVRCRQCRGCRRGQNRLPEGLAQVSGLPEFEQRSLG